MKWYLKAFRNYFTFTGRAERKEYWCFVLFNLLFSYAPELLEIAAVLPEGRGVPIICIYILFAACPGLAVSVRRLHDTNRSGHWLWISLIPFVNLIFIYFMVQKGTVGPNCYGKNPKVPEKEPDEQIEQCERKITNTSVAEKTKKPVLLCVGGEYKDSIIELENGPVIMGRNPTRSNLVFSSMNISNQHCAVDFDADSMTFTIEDIGSSNGTFLENGKRIAPGQPVRLKSGDGFYISSPSTFFKVSLYMDSVVNLGQGPESSLYLAQGSVLNQKYLIGRVLGHGGFGITYLAQDLVLNIDLCIKEYFPTNLATRAQDRSGISVLTGENREHFQYGLEKFLDEARVMARFEGHPGIVSVKDFFQENSTAYLVMHYLEGMTFKEYLKSHGEKIDYGRALRILIPVMDALQEVHKTGMLHRDISPGNIYITTDGRVKLLDFGAARYFMGKHSKNLSVILKPGFAPEEQYRNNGKQGPWTDIYALGATFYRAITGVMPPEALNRMDEDTLGPPSRMGVKIPSRAEQALMKALAVKAPDRFLEMEEFQQAIVNA
nr:DUF805 domain-containing protein [uncultured Desulfobacter sp.]